MISYLLAFILGVGYLFFLKILPPLSIILILIIIFLTALSISPKKYRGFLFLGLAFWLGVTWGDLRFTYFFKVIPQDLFDHPVTVIAQIETIPEQIAHGYRVVMGIKKINNQPVHFRAMVNAYLPTSPWKVGEIWQTCVRFSKPHGMHNPGGFDYEGWLFSQGIHVKGQVILCSDTYKIQNLNFRYFIDRERENIQTIIAKAVSAPNQSAILSALAVGSRSQVTPEAWDIFQNTGTNHLIAIAGLHLGFIFLMVYGIVKYLWRFFLPYFHYYPASKVAAFIGLIVVIIYSVLAGLSIPTQRASIMLTVLVFSEIFNLAITLPQRLCLALGTVIFFEPAAFLSESFWLSFFCMAWIGYLICGRKNKSPKYWAAFKIQCGISFGLLPITLWFFQKFSWLSFPANFVAIPWIGFCILPFAFISSLVSLISVSLSAKLFYISSLFLSPLWWYLKWLGGHTALIWHQGCANYWILMTTIVGMVFLFFPKGLPGRWLGFIWLLPILLSQPILAKNQGMDLTLLDVGQGLAAVIRTQHHVLLFDAGPHMPLSFDAGSLVILPYLLKLNIKHLDKIIISHGDNDHIGGVWSILLQEHVGGILTSVPRVFLDKGYVAIPCFKGQAWNWDGVSFSILNPLRDFSYKGNNSSCVLKVTVGKTSLLLTGDIEKNTEMELINRESSNLSSQILVVPHHGSITSSTQAFIQMVNPDFALFPVGYHNRYHFPSTQVLSRYQLRGSGIYRTDEQGAIFVRLSSQGEVTLNTMSQRYCFWNSTMSDFHHD